MHMCAPSVSPIVGPIDYVFSYTLVCLYFVHFDSSCTRDSFLVLLSSLLLYTRLFPIACDSTEAFVMSV